MSVDPIDRRLAEVTARIQMASGKAPGLDLASRTSWKASTDISGNLAPRVIVSLCGRFTIVEFTEAGPGRRIRYQAFRRYGKPERERWDPPDVIDSFDTPEQARAACVRYLEQEPRP